MGNHQRDLRLHSGLRMDSLAEIVKEVHPNFDKSLLSKCENPEKYGVKLDYQTFKHLYQSADPEGWEKYKRRTDGHLMTCRIYGRLPDSVYHRLIEKIHRDGYKTVQQWILDHVLAYIYTESEDT